MEQLKRPKRPPVETLMQSGCVEGYSVNGKFYETYASAVNAAAQVVIDQLEVRYEELRIAAKEAVNARAYSIRYDHGEPDRPIMKMAQLKSVLRRHEAAGRATVIDKRCAR